MSEVATRAVVRDLKQVARLIERAGLACVHCREISELRGCALRAIQLLQSESRGESDEDGEIEEAGGEQVDVEANEEVDGEEADGEEAEGAEDGEEAEEDDRSESKITDDGDEEPSDGESLGDALDGEGEEVHKAYPRCHRTLCPEACSDGQPQ